MPPDKRAYSTKLPKNTGEWLEEYAERKDITKSDAMRQIIEEKRQRELLDEDFDDTVRAQQAGTLVEIALVAILAMLTLLTYGVFF